MAEKKHKPPLTKAKIEKYLKAEQQKRYGDGKGLWLNVTEKGSGQWYQRIVINDKRRDIGLGPLSIVDIDEAREKSFDLRRDVYHAKRSGSALEIKTNGASSKTILFKHAAVKTWASKPKWSEAYRNDVAGRVDRHSMAELGELPLDAITEDHILKVLKPVWKRAQKTGQKLKNNLWLVFKWGGEFGYISENPVKDFEFRLPADDVESNNQASLKYDLIGEAIERMKESRAYEGAKMLFQFQILTAVRPDEARLANWHEINFQDKRWEIVKGRMKKRKTHFIPLSEAALEVLEQARALFEGDLIFQTTKGRPISKTYLNKWLRKIGYSQEEATMHGKRSTFATWAETRKHEQNGVVVRKYEQAAITYCLSHKNKEKDQTTEAYLRDTRFDERKIIMQAWGAYATEI